MIKSVLVVYASKYGATTEIADKIGEVLRAEGLKVDVRSAKSITDLGGYGAIVLGSAIYAGNWMKEASLMLQAHEGTLASRPVWFFTSGPTGTGDAAALVKGVLFPENIKVYADRIKPRDVVMFHGKIDMSKLNFAEKLIMKAMKAPIGDFRDWDAITAWAKGIAAELNK